MTRVIKLHEQGVSHVAIAPLPHCPIAPLPHCPIATLLGLDRDTVRRSIKAPAFPEIVRTKRGSSLDPYRQYLHERWATGQCTASSLLSELRERGYQGGETLVYDSLRQLREQPEWWEAYQQQKARQAQGKRLAPLSAREAAWLFICNPVIRANSSCGKCESLSPYVWRTKNWGTPTNWCKIFGRW